MTPIWGLLQLSKKESHRVKSDIIIDLEMQKVKLSIAIGRQELSGKI